MNHVFLVPKNSNRGLAFWILGSGFSFVINTSKNFLKLKFSFDTNKKISFATFLLINSPDDVLFVNLAYGIGFLFSGFFSIIYLTTRQKVFLSRFKIRAVLEEIRDSYHFFLSNVLSYATLFFLGPLTGAIISYEAAGIYSILEKKVPLNLAKDIEITSWPSTFRWVIKMIIDE